MDQSECVEVSEEWVTRWKMTCGQIDHLGSLIETELRRNGQPAWLIDRSQRFSGAAASLGRDLRRHGAGDSNARLRDPKLLLIDRELLTRWAEQWLQIRDSATLIGNELPKTSGYARAINLLQRSIFHASEIYADLTQLGLRGREAARPITPETR